MSLLRRWYGFEVFHKVPTEEQGRPVPNNFRIVHPSFQAFEAGYTEGEARRALAARLRNVFIGDVQTVELILLDMDDFFVTVLPKGIEASYSVIHIGPGRDRAALNFPRLTVPFEALFGQMATAFDEVGMLKPVASDPTPQPPVDSVAEAVAESIADEA